jgi:hypothetical protein
MTRYIGCAFVFIFCVAIVGAQGPRNKLTAAEQSKLFQRNRSMIQSLVRSSIDISASRDDFLKRSKTYEKVLEQFHEEIVRSANEEDAGRVAELGKHLSSVIEKGLTPNLKDAARQIGQNGTNWDKLKGLQLQTVDTLESLQSAAQKKWPKSTEVNEMIKMLDKAKDELHQSVK